MPFISLLFVSHLSHLAKQHLSKCWYVSLPFDWWKTLYFKNNCSSYSLKRVEHVFNPKIVSESFEPILKINNHALCDGLLCYKTVRIVRSGRIILLIYVCLKVLLVNICFIPLWTISSVISVLQRVIPSPDWSNYDAYIYSLCKSNVLQPMSIWQVLWQYCSPPQIYSNNI